MRVCVVAEFYPRAHDPVIGIWAHRQAMAARDAGAEVRVVVLHRPIPPLATPKREMRHALGELLRQPRHATIDGLPVDYVRFLAPPRPRSYGSWGAWAAPTLALHLRRLQRRWPFELIHAHSAVPSGEAVRRARLDVPVVVSSHGADTFFTATNYAGGLKAVQDVYGSASVVLANSKGIERAVTKLGARRTSVVRLGTDIPLVLPHKRPDPTLVTVAHLVGRKRQGDVIRALWILRDRHPRLRHLVVGDGPERGPLETLTKQLGLEDRVEFAGQLPNPQALQAAWSGHLFVLPSVDEAFGVAYVEAMAGGLPAIACLGEPGPAEIEEAGPGISLVAPGDIPALASAIDRELSLSPREQGERSARARRTVERHFTWERCGRATVTAYELALR
ncbi:MAG: glycosyl transferase group 1 [Solirubrobacterales bacterium]|nr:glycosyl transferase group 1 [Solirubrobacterales bacterium]